ncbi:hypothetical protein [Burkholderia plantarii]|nr:hypothetical protein [Burkholderia plantarii]
MFTPEAMARDIDIGLHQVKKKFTTNKHIDIAGAFLYASRFTPRRAG